MDLVVVYGAERHDESAEGRSDDFDCEKNDCEKNQSCSEAFVSVF
jgi:hypothetical protein